MKIKDYLKDKAIFIIINIIFILASGVLLIGLKVDRDAIILVSLLNLIGSNLYYIYDYVNRSKYYKNLENKLEELDKKYFIGTIIEEGDFLEGKIIYNLLNETTKSMMDKIGESNRSVLEYKEYIELWVHEIKTPIATTRLLIENNENSITKSIEEEIIKVEDYIEQVLFYARSNNVEKDYLIRKVNLKELINSTIKRNANMLIEKSVKIETNNIDKTIFTDKKWTEFIFNQILSNSIKYMDKENSILKIESINKGENVILSISDNGMGMDEKTLRNAFEKGYTGENGRKFGKSTGMGLYICKNLCEKLGLNINIQSKINEGTEVTILFPINNMINI